MRFYTNQHRYYCGIDLHARSMYLCILDQQGEILLHRNMGSAPDSFLKAIAPYREDLVVAGVLGSRRKLRGHKAALEDGIEILLDELLKRFLGGELRLRYRLQCGLRYRE